MRETWGKSSYLRESSRRVTVLVVVLSGHLGLLVLLLRPVIFYRESTPVLKIHSQMLELRFFSPPHQSPSRSALPTRRVVAPVARSRSIQRAKPPKLVAPQPTMPADAQLRPLRVSSALPVDTRQQNLTGDTGFQARLHHAQRSRVDRGVPGSTTPVVGGIHFVDPMQQGIGAVMRTTQRAFGIASSHCVDVDVWRHLSPPELSARHISPSNVDKIDEKYNCNKPMGLGF